MSENTDKVLVLLMADNMIVAQDIKQYLEEKGVYTLIESDNPASSVMNVYTGMNAIESISIKIVASEFARAIKLLEASPYSDYIPDHPGTDRDP